MENSKGWFKRCVMSLSYKERRAKKLAEYRKRVCELSSMEYDELDFEYVNLKSEYEHKKSVLTIFIIAIALSMLMNIWKEFFWFIEKALTYAASVQENGMEIAKISFTISVIVAMLLTVIILYVLYTYMKEIKQIQRELLIIEEVRSKHSKTYDEIRIGKKRKMRVKECVVSVLGEIIFSVVMTIYLGMLNALNKELNACKFDNAFALLQYRDGTPIGFFVFAIILFSVGCLLIWRGFRRLRRECESFEETITVILMIIIIIGLLIVLIVLINNPILRAVLTAILVIVGVINVGK